jgi:hypothetical protein
MRSHYLALITLVGFGIIAYYGVAGAANSDPASPPAGDVNCSLSVDPVDSLVILRFDADLETSLPAGCPEPGDAIVHPVSAAISDLALRLGVAHETIAVREINQVIWSDACLGVHDRSCPQVLTKGYLISLRSDGVKYLYHSDCAGELRAASFALPEVVVDDDPVQLLEACG